MLEHINNFAHDFRGALRSPSTTPLRIVGLIISIVIVIILLLCYSFAYMLHTVIFFIACADSLWWQRCGNGERQG